jgi:hypothetical protein
MSSPEPTEPTESSSQPVATPAKGINWLALASFLLSLAGAGVGLFSLSLLNAAVNTPYPYGPSNPAPDYTVPSMLYWGSLTASVAAIVLGASQRPSRTGLALAGLLIGILATLALICTGAWDRFVVSFCGHGC